MGAKQNCEKDFASAEVTTQLAGGFAVQQLSLDATIRRNFSAIQRDAARIAMKIKA